MPKIRAPRIPEKQAVRFLHCSKNIVNYNICIDKGLAGFTIKTPQKGDLVYLLVRKSSKTVCGARGILKDKVTENPWPDREYLSVFTIEWETCKEFQVNEIAQISQTFSQMLHGKALDILTLEKGAQVAKWLNGSFNENSKSEIFNSEPSVELSYIWIHEFRNMCNLGFNISSKNRFTYDPVANELTIIPNERYIPNFFGKGIINVTGVVGQNGAGKTNLLELINYTLNEGNTKIAGKFFAVYTISGEFRIMGNAIENPSCNKKISFQPFDTINPFFDTIFLSNTFDGRKHDLPKKTIDRSTNRFFDNKFGENFLTNYKSDIQDQINFINSTEYRELAKIERQLDPHADINFRPTDIVITSPTWGNMLSRARDFDTSIGPKYGLESDWLKKFCQNFRRQVNRNTTNPKLAVYFTSFLVFIDFLLNEADSNNSVPVNGVKKLFRQLRMIFGDTRSMPIDAIHGLITRDITQMIDKEFPYNFERVKFLGGLNASELSSLAYVDEGSHSNRKVRFTLSYSEMSLRFIKGYLQATTNLNLTYNIEWGGISSGYKAYLGLFSRLHSATKELKNNSVILNIDEGDLYFHPKWQTEFLYKIVNMAFILYQRPVQVILTTHSPFLVSDLPKSNLIFLKKGEPHGMCRIVANSHIEGETFGGNIGELYLDAFFLEGSLISHFAASKIKPLIQRVNDNQLSKDDTKLIQQIGERLIKNYISRKISHDQN